MALLQQRCLVTSFLSSLALGLMLLFIGAKCSPLRVADKNATCIHGNMTYIAGEHFKPSPCTFCHCPRRGGRARCAVQDCMYEPNCLRFEKKTESDCCGACVEVGCLHSDGKVYAPGAVVSASECGQCYCPKGGGRVVCENAGCPDARCVDAVQETGECCPHCPNGKSH